MKMPIVLIITDEEYKEYNLNLDEQGYYSCTRKWILLLIFAIIILTPSSAVKPSLKKAFGSPHFVSAGNIAILSVVINPFPRISILHLIPFVHLSMKEERAKRELNTTGNEEEKFSLKERELFLFV